MIKFRAWDKLNNEMSVVEQINFYRGEFESIGYGVSSLREADKIELMQSTGLKDKNGKEIFEGDILAVEADDGVIILKVSWDDEHALFVIKTKKFNEEAALAELVDDNSYPFEVIGNIYENHELLEDSK